MRSGKCRPKKQYFFYPRWIRRRRPWNQRSPLRYRRPSSQTHQKGHECQNVSNPSKTCQNVSNQSKTCQKRVKFIKNPSVSILILYQVGNHSWIPRVIFWQIALDLTAHICPDVRLSYIQQFESLFNSLFI
jgi:hypothetical protein